MAVCGSLIQGWRPSSKDEPIALEGVCPAVVTRYDGRPPLPASQCDKIWGIELHQVTLLKAVEMGSKLATGVLGQSSGDRVRQPYNCKAFAWSLSVPPRNRYRRLAVTSDDLADSIERAAAEGRSLMLAQLVSCLPVSPTRSLHHQGHRTHRGSGTVVPKKVLDPLRPARPQRTRPANYLR